MKSFSIKFISLLISLVPSSIAYAETITLAADPWCPFTCDPAEGNVGTLVEIAQKIFQPKGITIDFKIMNWTKAIELTKKGEIDGIIGASHGDAPDLIFPKVPQGIDYNEYFKKAGNSFYFKGAKSLVGKKVAIIKDYFYDKENSQLQKSMRPSFVYLTGNSVQAQMIKMLQANRIDAAIESRSVFNWNLKKQNVEPGSIVAAGLSDSKPMDLYLAFNSKHPRAKELASLLTEGMTTLRKSGELEIILAKYGLTDWLK